MKPRPKGNKFGKFRSGLELKFAQNFSGHGFEFEPYSLPYIIKKNYKPDFVYEERIIIECKGFFRVGDTQKYKAIRDEITQFELVFVLSDPNKKVRKGSKLTMGQWCDKEGLAHFTVGEVDRLLAYIGAI
jgi:hypothetical protein